MHSNLWIFNPDHDMALAVNSPYYMPPNSVKKMINDLSFLPAWYAPDDCEQNVIVPYYIYKHLKNVLLEIMPGINISYDYDRKYDSVFPWGWNSAILNRLSNSPDYIANLPDKGYIDKIRELSNRKIVAGILSDLILNDKFCGESFYVNNMDSVNDLLGRFGKVVVKAPWSGSGRGVRFIEDDVYVQDRKWIERILSSQKGIVVEPLYNKVYDFAMEFELNDHIDFIGYSAFETDKTGSYKENILASNEMIENRLCQYVNKEDINLVREALEKRLSELLKGEYKGPFGVDMMICIDEDGKYKIHPCVEINLRMNMGIVSRKFYDRYVTEGNRGRYVIEFYKNGEMALESHNNMKERYPLVMKNGRIESGYFSLTPMLDDTQYQIYVIIE